uniref:Uncharacterized protein n=1 Tax=Picea sitchensis TaxID=3332 RepID=A0A6B9XXJ7_PICSI|nr:hypothetical protein Q903MT_gene6712 [Picea sitchensis]
MEELHLVAIATGRGRNIDKPPTIFYSHIRFKRAFPESENVNLKGLSQDWLKLFPLLKFSAGPTPKIRNLL